MSGRPSVYEYVQEWIWRFSDVTGIPKYVFLAIGREFKRTKTGEFITDALPLEDLADITGMSDATVRRSIKVLERATDGELEAIRTRQRGTAHRYRLRRELKLPLMDADPSSHRSHRLMAPVTLNDEPPVTQTDGTGQPDRCDRSQGTMAPVCVNDDGSADAISSEVVRTEVLPTTTEEEEVAAFLGWFAAEYHEQRGVSYRSSNPTRAAASIRELLTGRTVARGRAMALAMWRDTGDPWLNDPKNDRGVFSLLHKSTYLEGLVVGQESPKAIGYDATARCPHTPKHVNPWDCSAYRREAVG